MEKKSKKSVVIGITILLLVTLILLGLTYAYYRTRIVGNNEEKSISVTSKKLEVTYSDDKAVIEASDIEPGYTATKIFSVENTGSEPTNFGIVLDNVENTFTRKSDWTFVLKQGDNVIKEGVVPSSKTYIANTISIEPDETIEYTLTITYANLKDVNQSDDMGSTLSLRVNIDNETGVVLESATEGTLLAAIGNDNLISEPLTVPGKTPSGVKYYEGISEGGYSSTFRNGNESNYIVYGTDYGFDEESGRYYLKNVNTCVVSDCYDELVGYYLLSGAPSETSFADLDTAKLEPTDNLFYLYQVTGSETRANYPVIKYSRAYAESDSINEALLAQTEDDYGTSYYFRGDVKNNYVTFSGMCWRVVRVQGDGSIKLALADGNYPCSENVVASEDGTFSGYSTENAESAFIADSLGYYNSNVSGNQNDILYANSDVKTKLDTWISNSNEDGSSVIDTSKLVEMAKWCQDTAVTSKTYWDENNYYTTEANAVLTDLNYAAFDRLSYLSNANPTLKCSTNSIDGSSSTVVESNVGLLTADELAFAGFVFNNYVQSNIYLRTNAKNKYWAMTPSYYLVESKDSGVFMLNNHEIYNYNVNTEQAYVRPSIVLKNDVTISSGDGTQGNAYVIG